jgi:5'-nucleotidase
VIVAGHSHSFLNNRVNGKLIIEAFSFGTAFDQVNMKVDRRTGEVLESSAEVITTFNDEAAGVAPDPATSRLVADYKARITPISERVVGNAATTITRTADADGESALGDLIADAQREYAGAQIAFMNPGGIRQDIQAGEVTYGELFTVQPFDNQVVRMELTGDQIYRLLEQQFRTSGNTILQVSGIKVSYNASNPEGQRISSLTLSDGTPVQRGATYTVAANSFIATGGDGFTVFKEGQNPTTIGPDVDALEAHVSTLPQPFGVPADFGQRITKQG